MINRSAYLVLPFLGITLGSVNFLTATALDEMDPILVLTIRAVVGTSVLLPLTLLFRVSILAPMRRYFWVLLIISLTNYVAPWLLITWGQTHTESGTAGVLVATSPVFTALMAGLLLPSEPLRMRTVTALVIGLVGVALIAGMDFGHFGPSTFIADVAIVVAAASFAFAAILVRRVLAEFHVLGLVSCIAIMSVVILVPLAAVTQSPGDLSVSREIWAALIPLGIFSGVGVSFPLYFWVIRQLGAVRSSFLFYISPAVAVLLGWSFRDESLTPFIIGGLLLILFSLAWANEMILPTRLRRPLPKTEETPHVRPADTST